MNTVPLTILEHRFSDGASNQWRLFLPPEADTILVWMPALGVAARHYDRLAQAFAQRNVGVALMECRGIGASSVRAGRRQDFGYHEILQIEAAEMMSVLRQTYPQRRWWLGGHSLGGQLATLFQVMDTGFDRLLLVGTGSPWYRCYGSRAPYYRWIIHLAAGLSRLLGYYPGRMLRFGGDMGLTSVHDWIGSALTGRFSFEGSEQDLEWALARSCTPVLSIWFREDPLISREGWLYLLDKMPRAARKTMEMGQPPLTVPADHFAWMKAPEPVVDALLHLNEELSA